MSTTDRPNNVRQAIRFTSGGKSARSAPFRRSGEKRMARANHTETITRLRFASGVAVHTLLPPHDIDGYTTTSRPFAIGVSFTGHGHAVLESVGGARFTRSFGPGTIGINGPQPVRWLRVAERSEGLEIIPSQVLLAAAADEFDITWTSLDRFLQVERDPVVWGICARYRMAILGAWPLPELQSDELTWGLLAHVAGVYFGAPAPRPRVGRLDPRRLARVAEFIESSLLAQGNRCDRCVEPTPFPPAVPQDDRAHSARLCQRAPHGARAPNARRPAPYSSAGRC
jgi:hypothetical protein